MIGRYSLISPLTVVVCVLHGVLRSGTEMALRYADKMSAFDIVAKFLLKYTLLSWISLHNSHLGFSYPSGCYFSIYICCGFLMYGGGTLFLYPLRFSLGGWQIKLAKDRLRGGKA